MTESDQFTTPPDNPRRIHLGSYANTFAMTGIRDFQFGPSYGCYIDTTMTDCVTPISDVPAAKSMRAVWHAVNKFMRSGEELADLTEFACNTIAVVDTYKRHDDVVSDDDMRVISSMARTTEELSALENAHSDIKRIVSDMQIVLENFNGVLKGECKVNLQDRLERILKETIALKAETAGTIDARSSLPNTPYALRRVVMSELLLRFDTVIEQLSPLNTKEVLLELPSDIAERIKKDVTTFQAGRSRLRKWRDNPSQKFGSRFKEFTEVVDATICDVGQLKNEMFDLGKAIGARFYNRGGFIN
ncbi:MAG TPA: hypothetical protein V6C76_01440 [Drouetiella sp.]